MKKRITWMAILLLWGCIDPVDFKYDGSVEHLVIEGKFSNDAAGNYVRLSLSRPFETPYYVFVEDAIVYVSSEEGERFDYHHSASGYYYPDDGEITGIPGHTYTLHVITDEGNVYESEPAEILPIISIDSVRYSSEDAQFKIEGMVYPDVMPGYRFYADYSDPGDEDNFYRWSYNAEFEIETQPQDYMLRGCVNCPIPAPKSCCAQCWLERGQDVVIVGDDRLSNGQQVTRQPLFFIPFEMYMNIRMKLTVKQHAISQKAYNYFQALELQKETTGEIFDPPPTEVKGNIHNINDETEQVIGLFEVSSIATKEVIITPNIISSEVPKFIYPDDCLEIDGATTEMPYDWY